MPISTGGGKALYVGTYLPADGEYQRVKAILVKRYQHRDLAAALQALERRRPDAALRPVADRYPDLPRDSALGKIGKQNFSRYFGEDPVGYLAMTARKVGRMWSSGIGEAMRSDRRAVVQILLVALGLAGWRSWRAPPLVGAGGDGDPDRPRHRGRRGLPRGPAAQRGADDTCLSACRAALSSGLAAIFSGREWSRLQASSPPN